MHVLTANQHQKTSVPCYDKLAFAGNFLLYANSRQVVIIFLFDFKEIFIDPVYDSVVDFGRKDKLV